jgi:GTP-binding protein
VILVSDPSLTTLLDHRYQREYRAERGQNGQGHDRFGRGGEDLRVVVPNGTVVHDAESGEILADLASPGQELVAARGGRGGFGNLHYVSSTNRAPRRGDPGDPGEERVLRLELKLIADAGLVGLPNAGKSTLLARISAARPKIADYPFTTLTPCLGVARLGEERSLVVADIPGLIEGAHQGAGMGHRFLRHIERTRVLVYLLDDRHLLEETPGSPLEDLRLLRAELEAHSSALAEKPALVVLNKCDVLSEARIAEMTRLFQAEALPFLAISAATGRGVADLLQALWDLVHPAPTDLP